MGMLKELGDGCSADFMRKKKELGDGEENQKGERRRIKSEESGEDGKKRRGKYEKSWGGWGAGFTRKKKELEDGEEEHHR